MDGLLSTMWKRSKTYYFIRKWAPWGREGGGWVPWGGGDKTKTAAATAAEVAAAAAEVETEIASAALDVSTLGEGDDVQGDFQRYSGVGVRVQMGSTGGGGGSVDIDSVHSNDKALREGRWLPTELVRFVEHVDSSLHAEGRSQPLQWG